MASQHVRELRFVRTMQDFKVEGKLPAYAWPGGYDLLYHSVNDQGEDFDYLCADCANLYVEARGIACDEFSYYVTGVTSSDSLDLEPNETIQCSHCYRTIVESEEVN